MAAVLFLGCARNNNPAAPAEVGGTPERQAEYFTSALPLFIPAALNYYGYNDVDSAVLLNLSTHNPAVIESFTWTAFVSLERRTVSYFVPVFHWVPSGPGTPLASPPDSVPYSPGPCYRFPKCDAVQFANGSIELAVCYEVLDSTNLDWDIGVTRIVWASAGVFPGTFTRLPDQVFDGAGSNWGCECPTGAQETDEHCPDISYDPDNGDIYLAYSDFVSGLPLSYSQLKYRRFPRSSGSWSQEYSASPLNSYSATMPRIDVGRMDGLFGVNDLTCIGITYAAQFCNNHTGYHVHVIYGVIPSLMKTKFLPETAVLAS